MAKREVGIYFRAYDQTSRPLHGIGAGLKSLQRQVIGLAGAYIGVRGLTGAIGSFVAAAAKQEEAEIALHAAVGANIAQFKSYASEMQKRTRYGDEAILAEMAYGANLGVTTDRLQEATTAAVGLAAKYRIDLRSAMMLVGRASQGQTQMLTRYGIILDETLSDQGKFDELLRIGADSFGLAEEAAKSLAGKSEQLKNRWGDLKEQLGKPIAEAAIGSLEKLVVTLEKVNEAMQPVSGQSTALQLQNQLGALPDAAQEAIRKAYRQHQQSLRRQMMDRGEWVDYGFGAAALPNDPQYLQKLMNSYARAQQGQAQIAEQVRRQRAAGIAAHLGPGFTPSEGYSTAAGPREMPPGTPIDYDAAYKAVMATYKETSTKTVDVTESMARMYDQIDSKSAASFAARLDLLDQQKAKYEAMGISAQEWYDSQKELWQIEKDMATGGLFAGFRAGIAGMQRELQTIGELGADLGQTLRDGIVGSLTDAIFEARDLGDAMREVGRSMARMATEWALNQAVTRGLSSLFPAPVAHGGGLVGSTAFPVRGVSPALFAGAPRLHNGLAADEFPAILQRGERVIPKGGGGAPNVSIQVVNNGQAKTAQTTRPQFDGHGWVIGVILDDLDHGGPLSERMR